MFSFPFFGPVSAAELVDFNVCEQADHAYELVGFFHIVHVEATVIAPNAEDPAVREIPEGIKSIKSGSFSRLEFFDPTGSAGGREKQDFGGMPRLREALSGRRRKVRQRNTP